MIVRTVSLLLLLVFVTGCTQATETADPPPAWTSTNASISTESPSSTAAPNVTETLAATESPVPTNAGGGGPVDPASQCANAYYPVREGATWTYTSTGGPTGGYGFTDTITAARQDGFTLTSRFGDLTRTQEWSCTPEGLVALQLGGASERSSTTTI